MDGCSGKRGVDGLVVSRRGSGLVLRENMNDRDKRVSVCSRIGCGARINATKGTRVGSLDKAKSGTGRPLIRTSSNGKEIAGNSSRASSAVGNARKSSAKTGRQLSSLLETDASETSSIHDEPEASESVSPPGKIKRGPNNRSENSDTREVISSDARNSSIASSTRTPRSSHQRSGLESQDTLVGSSVSLPARSSSQAARGNLSRNGLRNLRCNSISDVVQSSENSSLGKKKDILRKRNSDEESSSSIRGRKMNGTPAEGRNQNPSHGVSITDTRRTRYLPANSGNGFASASTRRATNSCNRTRRSNQGIGNNASTASVPEAPQPEIPADLDSSLSAEISFGPPGSYSGPESGIGQLDSMITDSTSEAGRTRSLINWDSFRHYNMDGIAEVLLALERIEQEEELTDEQLLVLETNLFLSGLNLYDQHREMRLDIDNMSYEELLALGERMGTVSTALSEEALLKCLETSIYRWTPLENETDGSCQSMDDVKCSICQEEYVEGEEVGRLRCEHRYHLGCVQQWLRMKNWCPICKASAESSSTVSQPSSSS